MNIYALKNKINKIKALNDPKQSYWLEFLQDMYTKELQAIADKVKKQLEQDKNNFYKSRPWIEYLAK
jgi:hypothetical protein